MGGKTRRLVKLFHRHRVMDMKSLMKATERARRSLFRDLSELNYLSSYTHAGRYYTLPDLPQFDENGLWFFHCAGFTQAGTLKSALTHLVRHADNGFTHRELQALLRIRVHNTLLGLVGEGQIGREKIEKEYLYVSPDPKRAFEQVAERMEQISTVADVSSDTSDAMVIEVLLELVYTGKVTIDPGTVTERLRVRGVRVSEQQVEQVFKQFGIDWSKKKPVSP